jgi:hypothetical protein
MLEQLEGVASSGWCAVKPMESMTLMLNLGQEDKVMDLVLATRIPEGAHDAHAVCVFEQIEIVYE